MPHSPRTTSELYEAITAQIKFKTRNIQEQSNFGILEISTPDAPTQFPYYHWVISIDISASMQEECDDGQSKITHTRQTVAHIVDFLFEHSKLTGTSHILTLVSFNHRAKYICESRVIDDSLLKENTNILRTATTIWHDLL